MKSKLLETVIPQLCRQELGNKMRYLFSIVCCLVSLTGCSQNESPDMEKNINKDTYEVLAVVRQLAELMIERDTTAMNKILDNEYTLTHITGYVQPKAAWFEEVMKESMKYYSVKEVSINPTLNGNEAAVTVDNLVDASIWGSRNTWRLRQQIALEKRNGNWIILRSIASIF